MDQTKIKEEVWITIQKLNRLWTIENNADELKNYFHINMVAISPTDKLRIEGRDACIKAWKNFTQAAKIHYWKEIDPKIEIFGNNNLAVVTYYFDMSFEMSGQTIKMSGRDMFTLVIEDGKWWVVADQFSANPQ
jgi:ketosteroid isomerase-like protein